MKTCSTCKIEKAFSEFYSDKRRPDGLKSQCKKCHCICSMMTRDHELHRDSNRRWMRESKYATRDEVMERERKRSRVKGKSIEARVRHLTNTAIRLDILKRPSAYSKCSESIRPIHAHHRDYSKPLEVEWLCVTCHAKEHRRVK